jgi:hypothetical protein
MTYYIYDMNGYVGDFASIQGLVELEKEIGDKLPTLFDDGVDDPQTVLKGLEGISSTNADIQSTIDLLRELAGKCKGTLIITDGVGIEEEEDESLQHGGPGSGWTAEDGHVPGSQGGSGKLESYGGLPGVGGYGSGTEYEIGHQVYAEAAHCVLGSLHKITIGSDFGTEASHIEEEITKMEEAVGEYRKPVYDNQNKERVEEGKASKDTDSIQKASKSLSALVSEKSKQTSNIKDPDVKELADFTYEATKVLADKAQEYSPEVAGKFNVFRDKDVYAYTQRVRNTWERIKQEKGITARKRLQHGGPGSGWYAEEGHVPGSQGGSGPGGGGEEMPKEKESFMEENAAVALSTEMGMTRYNEVKAFSPAHEKALAKYTSSTYQDINGKLRAGSFLGGEKKTVEKMDELLDNAPPLPKGKDIYRGVGSTTGEKMIKNMKVGDICEDKGFQSFSTHPYTAGYFSRRTTSDEEMMATNKDHRVVIKVTTDGKTKGVLIGGAEHEVLLKRGQKLQCVGMEEIVEKPKGYRIKIVTHVYTMKAVD